MNSLLAAEGRKLNSGAGGLGGGISRRVFSNCLRKASLAAAWRLAGESFTLTTDMLLLPEEEPFRLDDEAFKNREGKRTDQGKTFSQNQIIPDLCNTTFFKRCNALPAKPTRTTRVTII